VLFESFVSYAYMGVLVCWVCQNFYLVAFTYTAGGQRRWNGATFASLKKYAPHFFQCRLRQHRTKRGD